jgi:flavin reductase (DIM6/NTAB) family NADH-FMN oxidoreductase RutF
MREAARSRFKDELKGPRMKRLLGPLERLFPMPCVLVVGGTMELADTLAVAWINVIASTPPTLAMGLRRTRRTLELIRETGDFTVNVPDTSLVAAVDYCGISNGRSTDKFVDSGLTLEPSTLVTSPMIAECPYNLECRVTSEVEVGEYVVILGEIVETHAEERILRAGTDVVDMDSLDPLSYIAGAREYRAIGRKVADAYSVGKSLKPTADGS